MAPARAVERVSIQAIKRLMTCFMSCVLVLKFFCGPGSRACPRSGSSLRPPNEGGENACRGDTGTDQQRDMKAAEKLDLHGTDFAVHAGLVNFRFHQSPAGLGA